MVIADRAFRAALVSAILLFAAPARSLPNTPEPRREEPLEERPATIVALDWRRGPGAEGCIDAPTLEREVEGRLERRIFGNAMEADVFLRGQVDRGETDFHVRLTMVAANGRVLGERELRADA